MINIIEKKRCSGCSACYNICPVDAISMECDNEGFLYPRVNEEKCINCGMCENTCPYVSRKERNTDLNKCFAAYNKNDVEREMSSSGGIFILLAKKILQEGGVVYGAAYDGEFLVYHKYIDDMADIRDLVGSKYMQSRIGKSFSVVKKFLKQNRKVLFVGTSCQIGGLRAYLQREYKNLVCVDFICLGTPSPKVWKDYLVTYFPNHNIKFVNFKNKEIGWHNFSLNIITDKGDYCKSGRDTYFFTGYFKHIYSRPSCSECIFKNGNRDSDITISDCWGYHYIAPEMDDNKGLSSIECHSKLGLDLFESIKESLAWKEANVEDVLKYNSNYCKSASMGIEREDFWHDYEILDKKTLFEKYCSPPKVSLRARIKKWLKIKIKRLGVKG